MIVSKIRGGLGNQLFEWAAGYALAKANNTEFLLDLSVYDRNQTRQFQLDKFKLPYRKAIVEEIEAAKRFGIYRQPFYHYDTNFEKLPSGTFLRGYFCSEKYFLNARCEIRELVGGSINEILFSEPQSHLLQKIRLLETVSIHIRRGDYVSNVKYNDFFGTCSLDYYREAVRYIEQKLLTENLLVIVFSDDLEWARENLTLNNEVVYADVNSAEHDHLDLLFMANCDHNIIANSTFSWWSAWINPNPSKVVVAPNKWFNTNYRKRQKNAWIQSPYYNTRDLYPSNWKLL